MPLLILSCIVLLPIFPAYFLFKALPTASGSVAGTLAGLKIKLGGAFAGYFAVVLLIFLAHDIWNPAPPPPAYQVWEVSGQVTDEAGRIVEPLDVKDILLVPPTFQYSPGGHFILTFATMPAPGGGIKYPILSVNYPNFQVATIPLDPAAARDLDGNMQLERDEARREISIKRVVLRKLPDYSPTGKAAPTQVPATAEVQ